MNGFKIVFSSVDRNYIILSLIIEAYVIDYIDVVQTNLKIEKDNVVVVFSNSRLFAVSCIDGEVLWKKDFEAERLV